MNPVRVGITGGTGFIGSFLFDYLKTDYTVLRTVRKNDHLSGSYLCSDISEVEQLDEFLRHSDVLVHLANQNRPRDQSISLSNDLAANLTKSLKLFEAYYQTKPEGHIIYFSTGGAIYHPKSDQIPFKESDLVAPHTSYGIQKLAAEGFLQLLCKGTKRKATILRVSNPYGVPLSPNRSQGLIGVAASCALQDKNFYLYGNAGITRDYLHLNDLGNAIKRVIHQTKVANEAQVYNLGSGIGHTTAEVITLIERYAHKKLNVIHEPAMSQEAPWNILDASQFRSEFSWSPEITFEQGIQSLMTDPHFKF